LGLDTFDGPYDCVSAVIGWQDDRGGRHGKTQLKNDRLTQLKKATWFPGLRTVNLCSVKTITKHDLLQFFQTTGAAEFALQPSQQWHE